LAETHVAYFADWDALAFAQFAGATADSDRWGVVNLDPMHGAVADHCEIADAILKGGLLHFKALDAFGLGLLRSDHLFLLCLDLGVVDHQRNHKAAARTALGASTLGHAIYIGESAQAGKSALKLNVQGQCKLVKSGANLLLQRFDGCYIQINGLIQLIPAAGISLGAIGLTVSTLYYVYAYMAAGVAISSISISGTTATVTTTGAHGRATDDIVYLAGVIPTQFNGSVVITVTSPTTFTFTIASPPSGNASTVGAYSVLTLEASTTASAVDVATGMRIKAGDATRTLVGFVRPITGPAFQDTAAQRFVRSWFNDSGVELEGARVSGTTGSAAVYVEISASARVELLAWQGERAMVVSNSYGYTNSPNNTAYAAIGFDGVAAIGTVENSAFDVNGSFVGGGHAAARVMNEGYHYFTPSAIATSGFTATVSSALRGDTRR